MDGQIKPHKKSKLIYETAMGKNTGQYSHLIHKNFLTLDPEAIKIKPFGHKKKYLYWI